MFIGNEFDHDELQMYAMAMLIQAEDKIFTCEGDGNLWIIDPTIPPECTLTQETPPGILFTGRPQPMITMYFTCLNQVTGERRRLSVDDLVPWASADGKAMQKPDDREAVAKLAATWYEKYGDASMPMPDAVRKELNRRDYNEDEDGQFSILP